MINSLDIGKYIYNVLNNNEDLMENCTKIYPLIADNDAKFPFVIYKRIGCNSVICKDGSYEDDVRIEIKVVSDKYAVGLLLAQQIRSLIQRQYVIYDGYEINDVNMTNANEDYIENAFIQTMQFTLKIND